MITLIVYQKALGFFIFTATLTEGVTEMVLSSHPQDRHSCIKNDPLQIKTAALDLHRQIIRWRRDLHRIPELSFDLHRTSQYIKHQLDEMHLPHQLCAGTGIISLIKGKYPGPTMALRTDMDALPIKEETGLPFASTNGNMHACGHDAHMAMLLGAAQIIAERKNLIKGSVKLIFQPAEEAEGGAEPMIAAGCLENPKVDAILGLHIGQIFPEVGTGQVGVCSGPVMAAVSVFSIRIKGKSAHVATPEAGIDAIKTASEIVLALQKLIPPAINPTSPATLSITRINGGKALNAICDEVTLEGDFRTVDQAVERYLKSKITDTCRSIAATNGAIAEVSLIKDFPATVNDPAVTRQFLQSAGKILKPENIIALTKPSMANEDMSLFLQEIPGTYFFLGSPCPYPHHHPKFDIDENILWIGSALFAQAALDFCSA